MEILNRENVQKYIYSIKINEEIYELFPKLFRPTFSEIAKSQTSQELIITLNKIFRNDRPILLAKFKEIISNSTLENSIHNILEYLIKYIIEQAIEISIGNTPLFQEPELSVDDIYMSLFIAFDKNILKYIRDMSVTELPPREIILSKHNSPNPVESNSPIRMIIKSAYPNKIVSEDGIYFIQNLIIYLGYKYRSTIQRSIFLDSLPNNENFNHFITLNPTLKNYKIEYLITDLVLKNIDIKTKFVTSNDIITSILHNKYYNFIAQF